MGTTFVGIGGKGFWMADDILELWLRLLALHVEDPADSNSPAHVIRTNWLLASRYDFGGCVPHCIEEAVSTLEGRRVVLGAIESLRTALLKRRRRSIEALSTFSASTRNPGHGPTTSRPEACSKSPMPSPI